MVGVGENKHVFKCVAPDKEEGSEFPMIAERALNTVSLRAEVCVDAGLCYWLPPFRHPTVQHHRNILTAYWPCLVRRLL